MLASWTVCMLLSVVPAAGRAGTDPRGLALRRTPIVEVFEKTKDAVVNISSTQIITVQDAEFPLGRMFEDIFNMPFLTRPRRLKRTSVGSGFVIHADGYIVTNAHVVYPTVERKIIFADKSEYDAEIVAVNEEHDLAVLKIDAPKPLAVIQLGRSDDLMIGETVIAIGNPLGYQHSLTTGVISALDRTLEFDNHVVYRGLIQTNAAINPGNSGGPLLNILGELIGINTAIRGDAQNIGFAIPVDHLRQMIPSMLSIERLKRVRLGLRVEGRDRAEVVEVVEDSPAGKAGIELGDRITAVDHTPVRDEIDFYIAMLGKRAGDVVYLDLARGARKRAVTVRLEPIPPPDGAELARTRLGIELQPLSRAALRRLGLRAGLLIVAVRKGSPADQVGIIPGDLLLQLGQYGVRTLEDVGRTLENIRPGAELYIRILRITDDGGFLAGARVKVR